MNYTVTIDDRSYDVEIEDIHARPIIACVDGHRFEVNPENGVKPQIQEEAKPVLSLTNPVLLSGAQTGSTSELNAPLPGTIVETFVKAGDLIESGQVVLVIEAMKMKNSIRSTRAGRVAEVLASPGQTVAHRQVLMRFES